MLPRACHSSVPKSVRLRVHLRHLQSRMCIPGTGIYILACLVSFWSRVIQCFGVCSSYGGVARVVIIQDGGRSVNSVPFKRKVTAFFSLLRSGRAPKCCVGLFAGYRSLVINRNESISDV